MAREELLGLLLAEVYDSSDEEATNNNMEELLTKAALGEFNMHDGSITDILLYELLCGSSGEEEDTTVETPQTSQKHSEPPTGHKESKRNKEMRRQKLIRANKLRHERNKRSRQESILKNKQTSDHNIDTSNKTNETKK